MRQRKFFIITIIAGVILAGALAGGLWTQNKESPGEVSGEGIFLPSDILEPQLLSMRDDIIAKPLQEIDGETLLLYDDGGAFFIEYLKPLELFHIIIREEPVQEAKKAAQDWFLEKQPAFTQDNLCELNLLFSFDRLELYRDHPDFSVLPDGCPMPE